VPSLGTLAACRREVLAMAPPTPAIRMGDVYRDSPDGTWLANACPNPAADNRQICELANAALPRIWIARNQRYMDNR
jgi:hypothetical protein